MRIGADIAHRMFRSLGLRHLIVVDENYQLQGLLTRACFMEFYKPLRAEPELNETEDGEYTLVDDPRETDLDRRSAPLSSDHTPLLGHRAEYIDVEGDDEEDSKIV